MSLAKNPLEIYLAEIEATLAEMPSERRAEVLAETRSHLEAMMAARRTDGLSEVAAWDEVRRAFGEPELVGREIEREWKRQPRYETVGKPLTAQEKSLKTARMMLFMVPYSVAIFASMPWLLAHHSLGLFMFALAPLSVAFHIWRFRQDGRTFTPSTIYSLFFSFALQSAAAYQIQFAPRISSEPFGVQFSDWFVPFVLGGMMVGIVLSRWENKKSHPWRNLKGYSQNPMGAEDEHRFSTIQGAIIGLAGGCITGFWLRWQLAGLAAAAVLCGLMTLCLFLYGRWNKQGPPQENPNETH